MADRVDDMTSPVRRERRYGFRVEAATVALLFVFPAMSVSTFYDGDIAGDAQGGDEL